MSNDKAKIPESAEVKAMSEKEQEFINGATCLLTDLFRNIVTGQFSVNEMIKKGKTENGKDKNLYSVNYFSQSDKWKARLQLAFVFEENK